LFVCGFLTTLPVTQTKDHIAPNEEVIKIDKLEWMWKEAVVARTTGLHAGI
jgi:hypothetical protein